MAIKRVWIEEGCISCNLCEDLVPEVFEVPLGEFCNVKADAGRFLTGDAAFDEKVQEAADACPVEVIRLETDA